MAKEKTEKYWDDYYAGSTSLQMPPSQFAAFVLGESGQHDVILDVGCGNGRDSFFFGAFGKRVLGVDRSQNAIETCRKVAANSGVDNVFFDTADVSSDELADKAGPHLINCSIPLIYARFFIHAITDQDEEQFLVFARNHLKQGTLALEFRTLRDEALQKVTTSHYRRFVDPLELIGRARDIGLHATYYVEGFGLAKYKNDDAHTARVLLRTSSL